MFHVSTLLPLYKKDPQQLERKKHIGMSLATQVSCVCRACACASCVVCVVCACVLLVLTTRFCLAHMHRKRSGGDHIQGWRQAPPTGFHRLQDQPYALAARTHARTHAIRSCHG